MKDLYHNVLTSQHLSPINSTTTKTSTAIDLQGFNSATVVFAIGLAADTLSGSISGRSSSSIATMTQRTLTFRRLTCSTAR